MSLPRFYLFLLPALGLLAQAQPAPTVTLSVENAGTPAASPNVPADKVVLSVGDVKITAAEFDQIIDALPEQYRIMARGQGRRDFGQNLARIIVLSQEGKRRKLDQAPGYKMQAEFQTDNYLAQKTFNDLNDHIQVDDAAMKKYYDEHKGDYEQIRARHILIRAAGSAMPLEAGKKELSDAEALAKAQDLRKKIAAGADFAELAKLESDDTGSKQIGGDLNFFHRGQMVAPFEQAAFALKVGEVSQPVKTPFGYHLIKVEAKESKTYDEAKPELEKKLRPELAQKAIEDLEKKSSVTLDPVFFSAPASVTVK